MPRSRRLTSASAGDGKFQMAPMIDIVFLLLIFFICVTTFDQLETAEGIKLPGASDSKDVDTIPGTVVINLTDNGSITISAIPFSHDELSRFLRTLAAKHGPGIPVIIRADKKVRYGYVLKLMSICSGSGLGDVSFATYKEG